jgi:hypothetical protein
MLCKLMIFCVEPYDKKNRRFCLEKAPEENLRSRQKL